MTQFHWSASSSFVTQGRIGTGCGEFSFETAVRSRLTPGVINFHVDVEKYDSIDHLQLEEISRNCRALPRSPEPLSVPLIVL